eukprot:scaffold47888_cov26-Tisochrysis_lutea.AAC.1
MLQQVTQLHSSPVARAHSTGAPIEADRLLVHVLLLAPARRINEGYKWRFMIRCSIRHRTHINKQQTAKKFSQGMAARIVRLHKP